MPISVASQVVATTQVPQVVMDANAITTIISNINSMYNNVITVTLSLLGFVGVVLPFFLSFHQKRQLKADHTSLTVLISKEINAAKAELMETIKKDLANEISAIDKKVTDMKSEMSKAISKNGALIDAKVHHLQAISSLEKEAFVGAYDDCVSAMLNYAKALEETNLPTVMDNLLTKSILPKLNKKDFETNTEMKKDFEEAIRVVNDINSNGRYETVIRALRIAFNEATNRAD